MRRPDNPGGVEYYAVGYLPPELHLSNLVWKSSGDRDGYAIRFVMASYSTPPGLGVCDPTNTGFHPALFILNPIRGSEMREIPLRYHIEPIHGLEMRVITLRDPIKSHPRFEDESGPAEISY